MRLINARNLVPSLNRMSTTQQAVISWPPRSPAAAPLLWAVICRSAHMPQHRTPARNPRYASRMCLAHEQFPQLLRPLHSARHRLCLASINATGQNERGSSHRYPCGSRLSTGFVALRGWEYGHRIKICSVRATAGAMQGGSSLAVLQRG